MRYSYNTDSNNAMRKLRQCLYNGKLASYNTLDIYNEINPYESLYAINPYTQLQ